MEVLLRNLDQELAMVSLCSGSEISFVTAMALCEVLQVGKVSQVMSCKADVRKQGFVTEVIHKLRGGQGCLVEDVCDLASPRASCVAHGRRCKVRAGLIGSCGFSCKISASYTRCTEAEQIGCRRVLGRQSMKRNIGVEGTSARTHILVETEPWK